jgi:hypothetical protein
MTPLRWCSLVAISLVSTALLLVVGLLFAIHAVRQPGYNQSTADPAMALQDRPFDLRGQACDIVVTGDSTAAAGIDPLVLAAGTDLTACNIATNRPNVDLLGTLPLDAFLGHNPKPHLIVFQFGPETFYRAKSPWLETSPYTAIVMLSRHASTAEALRVMLRHPPAATQFVLYIAQHGILRGKVDAAAAAHYRRALEHAQRTNGQLDLELPAQTACLAPAVRLRGPLDAGWVDDLRQRYEAHGIRVLVRASPVPECDPQRALFQHDLSTLVDGNVEGLPIDLFVGGDRHTTQVGSQVDTLGLIRLIDNDKRDIVASMR